MRRFFRLILCMLFVFSSSPVFGHDGSYNENEIRLGDFHIRYDSVNSKGQFSNDGGWTWTDFGVGPMTYPGAGIALSTGVAWDTSITNNSANWNTAYGWGDHSTQNYLDKDTDDSTDLSDTADLLYEAELDSFSELQTQIADKTLINEEDAITFDNNITIDPAATFTVEGNIVDFTDVTDGYVLTFDTGTNTWAGEASGGGTIDGSGTANYTAKWSDSDTLTDSIIYDNGTNVGIGTTTTTEVLTVDGGAAFGGSGNCGIGTTTRTSLLTIYGAVDEGQQVLELDQNDTDEPFTKYSGTSAADQTKSISTVNGDGTVEGPKNYSSSAGWQFEGMVKIDVNGTDGWVPYYSADVD